MKRLFSKTFKTATPAAKPAQEVAAIPATTIPPLHHTGLQPKDTLPPVPHPCPYEHISLLATAGGLLLRPRHPGRSQDQETESEVRIEWGKGGKVHPLASGTVDVQWDDSVVVYGIVGILELYSGSFASLGFGHGSAITPGQRPTSWSSRPEMKSEIVSLYNHINECCDSCTT